MNKKLLKSSGRCVMVGWLASVLSGTTIAPFERLALVRTAYSYGHTPSLLNRLKLHVSDFVGIYRSNPPNFGVLQKLSVFYRGNMIKSVRYAEFMTCAFLVKGLMRKVLLGGDGLECGWMPELFGSLAAGGMAGFLGLSLVYPLEYCRVMMKADWGVNPKHRWMGQCFYETLKEEGLSVLYRGFLNSAIGITIYRAAYFGLYDFAKNRLLCYESGMMKRLALAQVTSTLAHFISFPIDAVRRRMMFVPVDGKHMGIAECIGRMYKEDGLFGFFRGSSSSFLRCTGAALCLVFYDMIGRSLFWGKDFGE